MKKRRKLPIWSELMCDLADAHHKYGTVSDVMEPNLSVPPEHQALRNLFRQGLR